MQTNEIWEESEGQENRVFSSNHKEWMMIIMRCIQHVNKEGEKGKVKWKMKEGKGEKNEWSAKRNELPKYRKDEREKGERYPAGNSCLSLSLSLSACLTDCRKYYAGVAEQIITSLSHVPLFSFFLTGAHTSLGS